MTHVVSLKFAVVQEEGCSPSPVEPSVCCSLLVRVWLLPVAWLLWAGSQRFSITRGVAFGGSPGLSGSHSAQDSFEARPQISLPRYRKLFGSDCRFLKQPAPSKSQSLPPGLLKAMGLLSWAPGWGTRTEKGPGLRGSRGTRSIYSLVYVGTISIGRAATSQRNLSDTIRW